MTTITFKSGILAFDSKTSAGGGFTGNMVKGRKTSKFLVAVAGTCSDCAAFLDWVESGAKLDDKRKFGLERSNVDISAIVINKKGQVFKYDDSLYPYVIDHKFYAIGSGADYAIGAMEHGATAVEAVKIASKYDAATGGKVNYLSWK